MSLVCELFQVLSQYSLGLAVLVCDCYVILSVAPEYKYTPINVMVDQLNQKNVPKKIWWGSKFKTTVLKVQKSTHNLVSYGIIITNISREFE